MMCLQRTCNARSADSSARPRPSAGSTARPRVSAPCFRRLRAGRGSRWADGLGRTHSERAVASSLGADHGELRLQARPPSGVRGGVAENLAAVQGGVWGLPGTGLGRGAMMEGGGRALTFFDGWLGGFWTPTFLAGQRMGTTAFTDVFAVAEFWATCTGQVMSLTPEMGK